MKTHINEIQKKNKKQITTNIVKQKKTKQKRKTLII